ncbi:MAG TPA: gamma-glutamyltransferase [Steroidobacteraceae bacterium]|jgi:gamma-glutamyltranspeptidase/glutathione hydrolase|nr:gamma-glutamyltransferase [Steroidobacteraceae bacterium]
MFPEKPQLLAAGARIRTLCGVAMALLAFGWLAVPASAQDRSQGRSMVISRGGIVAAESPLAAQAGATILAQGGNAIDAIVAANAVMGVVEPMMNGMGGDLFAIVYDAKAGKLYGLNASGWSPEKLTIGHLRSKDLTKMPEFGIDTVTVPGVVDGWSKLLARFGTRKLAEVLAPAITYARDGFPVPEWAAEYWSHSAAVLHADPGLSRTYLIDGHTPAVGEVFRNPDLARSLELVARGGRDAFYKGPIAARILALSRRLGGTMTAKDLADYSSEWVQPISTRYHGWTVYELPPNGQGIAALMMLNIMERFPLARYGHNSTDALHIMIEAKKLAYADLLRYVGDPRFSHIPVAAMLSRSYAARRAQLINMSRANCNVSPGKPALATTGDTTYLTAVDKQGNMVSLIQSNYQEFGSRLVADGAGFVLQDRGALFNLDPASPDGLAGHKRPLHTIIPAFMEHGEDRIAFGIMGGFNQAQAHAQFVSDVVDYGMDIQAALEAPRFTKMTFDGCDVMMEDRIPGDVRTALAARGHEIELKGDYSEVMGGGQAVLRNFSTGVNYGASDPRKDGEAIPQPLR